MVVVVPLEYCSNVLFGPVKLPETMNSTGSKCRGSISETEGQCKTPRRRRLDSLTGDKCRAVIGESHCSRRRDLFSAGHSREIFSSLFVRH